MGGGRINRTSPNLADALSNPSLQVKFEDKINTQEEISAGNEEDLKGKKQVRRVSGNDNEISEEF